MKKTIGAIVLLIIVCTIEIALAQTPGYTGNWIRNDDQTDAGGLSINTVAAKLEISKDAKSLYIKATLKNAAGTLRTAVDTLNLDGSKTVLFTSSKNKKQSGLSWSDDQKKFISVVSINDSQGTILQEWKQAFALSNDSKTLTVLVDLTNNRDVYHLKEVFDKQ